jgi:hypothetical protein
VNLTASNIEQTLNIIMLINAGIGCVAFAIILYRFVTKKGSK